MIVRLILFIFISTSLWANDSSWYNNNKLETKIEAGIYSANFEGTHSIVPNITTDFKSDFEYRDTSSSYLGFEFRTKYDYIPNFEINYLSTTQARDTVLDKNVEIVGFDFNGTVTTQIEFEVINAVISYEFKKKGKIVPFLWWKVFTGDTEYSLGVNVKSVAWNFQIIDRDDPTSSYKYISVNSLLPVPYFGFRYFYYSLIAYANTSAIALSDAKTFDYKFGLEYKVINNFSLNIGYVYEGFEAVEKQDTIKFNSSGTKLSVKYIF